MLADAGVVYLYIILPVDMTSRLPPITQAWHDFAELAKKTDRQSGAKVGERPDRRDRPQYFASYVDSIEDSSEPRLYFLHTELPHVPWKYLPNGKSYVSVASEFQIDGLESQEGKEIWANDDWLVTQGFQRHLLQTGFADKLLGDLLVKLKTVGLYERALVIVVADHGVSISAGVNRRNLSPHNLHDILPVPLLVKLPHQDQGLISDRNVQVVDILPTIAEVLNVDLPWRVDGRSLLETSQPDRTELTVYDDNFEKLVVEPVSEEMYETLARKLAVFGSGRRVDGLYRIGRYSQLIGQDLRIYPVDQSADVSLQLDGAFWWNHVDPESEVVPARISGRLDVSAEAGEPLHLAIVINGTIQAVTRTFAEGQSIMFSAIVAEKSFREGYNHVEVFVVSGPSDRPQLRVAINRQTDISYSLSQSNGREIVTRLEDQIVPIIPGAMGGTVDQGGAEGDVAIIAGWAADLRSSQPAESVLVLVNGIVIHVGRPNLARQDVADHFGNGDLLMSGFRLMFPPGALGDPADSEVRVVALSSYGVASELIYGERYVWGE